MLDPNFSRTVVLLAQHNTEGSVGFVMNRALEVNLQDVHEAFAGLEFPLWEGGPVQLDTLHYIHRIPNIPEAEEICSGVYWGGDYELIKSLLSSTNSKDIRFFLGYSGWAANQLDAEQDRRSWLTAEATAEFIFDTEQEMLWEKIIRNQGDDIAGLANYPRDPSWN